MVLSALDRLAQVVITIPLVRMVIVIELKNQLSVFLRAAMGVHVLAILNVNLNIVVMVALANPTLMALLPVVATSVMVSLLAAVTCMGTHLTTTVSVSMVRSLVPLTLTVNPVQLQLVQ